MRIEVLAGGANSLLRVSCTLASMHTLILIVTFLIGKKNFMQFSCKNFVVSTSTGFKKIAQIEKYAIMNEKQSIVTADCSCGLLGR